MGEREEGEEEDGEEKKENRNRWSSSRSTSYVSLPYFLSFFSFQPMKLVHDGFFLFKKKYSAEQDQIRLGRPKFFILDQLGRMGPNFWMKPFRGFIRFGFANQLKYFRKFVRNESNFITMPKHFNQPAQFLSFFVFQPNEIGAWSIVFILEKNIQPKDQIGLGRPKFFILDGFRQTGPNFLT